MAGKGPPKIPTEILALRGSRHVYGRLDEPRPEACIPEPPDWLSDGARAQWHPLATELYGVGLIGKLYTISFAVLCTCVARFIAVDAEANATPFTDIDLESGTSRVAAIQKAWDSCYDKLLKSCREFGLTPSSIASVKPLLQKSAEKKHIRLA